MNVILTVIFFTHLTSLADNVSTFLFGEDVVFSRGSLGHVASSEELRDEDRIHAVGVDVVRHIFEDEADVLIQ